MDIIIDFIERTNREGLSPTNHKVMCILERDSFDGYGKLSQPPIDELAIRRKDCSWGEKAGFT